MSDLGHKFTPDYRGTGIRSGDYVETSWRVAKRISQCLLEEAGKAEERDGPAGQGYADAIAAIDPNAPERYGEQLTVALKKISLDSSVPSELEEAALIDGCTPLRTFFTIVLPIMKPTYISVGILETMWIWNDFLLPYLTLDRNRYNTISMVVQNMQGSYGRVDMGAIMACLVMAVIPVVVFYLSCQKHIIKGVAAGAVKG